MLKLLLTLLLTAQQLNFACTGEYKYTLKVSIDWPTTPEGMRVDNSHVTSFNALSHKSSVTLWRPGTTANAQVEEVAVTGKATKLATLIQDLKTAGNAFGS